MTTQTALIIGGAVLLGAFLLQRQGASSAAVGQPQSYGYQGVQGGGVSEYQAAPAQQLSRGERILGGIFSGVTAVTGLLRTGTSGFTEGRQVTK